MKSLYTVILAAGKGTRMQAVDTPKVMYPLNGKPMIGYIADTLNSINSEKSIFVVGFHGQKVVDYLQGKDGFEFVWQTEQLGTGDALMQAESLLKGKEGITIVLNGDNPLFKPETLQRICETLTEKQAKVAVATVELDPSFSFGRVIIDETGHVNKIVEVKNATPEQLEIKTMNAGLYAFDNTWLWEKIHKIKINELTQEYYITDLVEIAADNKDKIIAVPVTHPDEAIGINTLDNLKSAEEALNQG